MALFDNRSSDLTDPLFSLLSISNRTFKDFPAPNDSDDLDPVHNFLKSKGLNNMDKLADEARAFVNSEVLGSKLAPKGASENNNETVTKIKRNLEERRPGLGLKRARPSFCLNPVKGPSVSLETTLDMDKLQDPDEFFSAFYKNEFARQEIERQTGGDMTGKNENNPPANQRRRRPSLFGKKASYKHKYSSAIPENDDTIITSQETLEQEKLSPSNFVSQKHSVELQEGQSGPVSDSENATGGMLDELLSRNIEDLDPDGALSLLQEQLQIKPLDLDKYLHDFSDAGNTDIMDLEEEMPVRRKALSDINVVNGLIDKDPVSYKQVTRDKSHFLMSSTPPKRPSAASSSFGEGKSLSKPFHFPFSAADLDLSPAKIPTHICFNGQSDELGTMNEPSIHEVINFQVENAAKSPASGSRHVIPGDICLGKSSSLDTRSTDIDTRTKHSHDGLENANECNHVGEILHEIVSSAQPDIDKDDLARGSPDTAGQAHGLTVSENVIENIHHKASSTQQDVDIVDSATENIKISQSESGNKEPIAAEDQFMDGREANAESGLEQQNEERPEISLKSRRKAGRRLGSREKKALTRRQSLAAAGTCWTDGVRRSNRIRIRPLEYWRGERFIRGRVHESLDTVIGIKCISTPSPGGKVCRFKVTSYMPEQKELVESIALH